MEWASSSRLQNLRHVAGDVCSAAVGVVVRGPETAPDRFIRGLTVNPSAKKFTAVNPHPKQLSAPISARHSRNRSLGGRASRRASAIFSRTVPGLARTLALPASPGHEASSQPANLLTYCSTAPQSPTSIRRVAGLAVWWVALVNLAPGLSRNAGAAEPLAQTSPAIAPASATPGIERAFISFRIGTPQWMPEPRYHELLALFEKYRGVTDEITFFTSFTHPPIPPEEMKRRCDLLSKRIAQAKALGYRAGINVLSTMGHHEENLPNSLSGDFTPVTDLGGGVSRGSFCPNDPRLQTYVRRIYEDAARANPDYLWIDDDVRLMGHMPVGLTCFCDLCLALFEKQSGTRYTRATLKAAFAGGDADQRAAVRQAWLVHNRATIARLLRLIERTVHGLKPGMPLGFMTGDRFFEGYDFDGWAEALAGPDRAPVYWRPGGGYYEDSATGGLAGKSHEIGRQVSFLPPSVLSIQSEIENFPYQRLRKAAHITVVEAASHLGAGCTGAAFNVLSGNDEPLDEFEPLVARIRQARPFYDLMAKYLGRARPVGLFTAWNKNQAAVGDFAGEAGSGLGHLGMASPLLEIGLPAAYHPEGAAVTLLFPQSVAAMSRDQIRQVLASGVYTDVATLNLLNQLGFQELTGMSAEQPHPIDCIEELTAHPLNGAFAGRQRDCRQSFYRVSGYVGYVLTPHNPKVETLARIVDYGGKQLSPSSLAIFENRLGGRICVAGYYPWDFLHSLSKTSQMKALMRWLARERLPAYVASYHKVNLWARAPHDGRMALALLNASFDAAEGLTLAVRTTAGEARVFDMQGIERVVRAGRVDGTYRHFVLPAVEPWTMRLVVVGP